MQIAFYYVDCPEAHPAKTLWGQVPREGHLGIASLAIEAIRRHMPGTVIHHLTDLQSAPLSGVDHVRRHPIEKLMLGRLDHYTELEGDWLFLDTDIIVQRNVQAVFEQPFDVAVTDRPERERVILDDKLLDTMPYNSGVIFSRCPEFWRAAALAARTLRERFHDWLGDQWAINKVIRQTSQFRILVLPGEQYNYIPVSAQDDVSQKAAVHYKGHRKAYLLGDQVSMGRRWEVLARIIQAKGWTRGVEVGVKEGRTILYLLRECPNLTMLGVDLWEPRPGLEKEGGESHVTSDLPGQYQHLRNVTAKYKERAVLLKGESTAIAQTIPDASLDFAFIDADHREFAVRADILAWLPKVKPGGMLCGHDYQDKFPGVKAAVEALCPGFRLHSDSTWTWPLDNLTNRNGKG